VTRLPHSLELASTFKIAISLTPRPSHRLPGPRLNTTGIAVHNQRSADPGQ
jgi:hypothetical protein